MIRVALSEGLLFLLPFAGFAVLLLLQRRRMLALESWSSNAVTLAALGLVLVLGGFLYEGIVADRPMAGFQPTHIEDGQVVPGRFR